MRDVQAPSMDCARLIHLFIEAAFEKRRTLAHWVNLSKI
jgi:hypothetical protein